MKYIITFIAGTIVGFLLSTFNHPAQHISEDITEFQTPNKKSKTQLKAPALLTDKPKLGATLDDIKTIDTPKRNGHSNTADTEELAVIINELKAENIALNKQYQNIRSKLIAVTQQKEMLDDSEITDQQMLALKADKFAQFRLHFLGEQRDDVFQFHQREEDLNWGYQMSIQISDFIQLHYNSNLVAVEGITCKINSCEVLIIELEDKSWEAIMSDMRMQPWWRFTSTQSSSSGGEKENLLYLYLTR